MSLKPVILDVHDLPELWFRALWELWNQHSGDSREYMVQHGSFSGSHKRKEFDYFLAHVRHPGKRPLVPIVPEGSNISPPTNMEAIVAYFADYIMGTEVAENETYTYGSRINESLDKVIEMLKKTPDTNQAIIEIGKPEDILISDPPCLRLIDCRIKEGKLHFIIYFRSWDLWAGLPQNLGGFQLLKEYMADDIGVEDGEMIVSSKGLHVYDYVWGQVEELIKYKK